MERRLAAILVADVVEFSRLIQADEAGTLSALQRRRSEILEPLLKEHRGRIVKLMGDGVLVEFASAVNAVAAAIALQQRMHQANKGLPEDRWILLRVGINLGDVVGAGSDVYGDGVNVAARLEPHAQPGGICVSDKVHEELTGKLDAKFVDLGERALKNIAKPVRVWQVETGAETVAKPTPAKHNISIAVLPFDNMSGIPEQDYIGDGIAENIITDLARFRDLTVIARNSSFAYKGRPTPALVLRRELGVDFVLEGSMQRAGDRIRITAQLIETASGKHVWVQRYDRPVDDLFSVIDSVTEQIVGTLGTTYGGRLRKAAIERTRSGPSSFAAFDHFLNGMQRLNEFTPTSLPKALDHFEEAVRLQPDYAKVHAKIAWAHLMCIQFGWSSDVATSMAKAVASANRAIDSDDAEAWAHWARAGCYWVQQRYDLAIPRFEKAVDLNPNDADVLIDMGTCLSQSGKAAEGLPYALKAIRINPHHPEYYLDQLAQIQFDARQYAAAVATIQKIRLLDTPTMRIYLAASFAMLGEIAAARKVTERILKENPSATMHPILAQAPPYALEHDREHLRAALEQAGIQM